MWAMLCQMRQAWKKVLQGWLWTCLPMAMSSSLLKRQGALDSQWKIWFPIISASLTGRPSGLQGYRHTIICSSHSMSSVSYEIAHALFFCISQKIYFTGCNLEKDTEKIETGWQGHCQCWQGANCFPGISRSLLRWDSVPTFVGGIWNLMWLWSRGRFDRQARCEICCHEKSQRRCTGIMYTR